MSSETEPGEPKPDLAEARTRIDAIDRRIQQLIAERFAHQVGNAKGKVAAAVDCYRPEREAQGLRRVVDRKEALAELPHAAEIRVPGSYPVAVP